MAHHRFRPFAVPFLLVLALADTQALSQSTVLVSRAPSGGSASRASRSPAVSADGRFVAFHSNASELVAGDTNDTVDVFVFDRQTSTVERVSVSATGAQANAGSENPAISADGRFVAFASLATNLTATGGTALTWQIYRKDRQTGVVAAISLRVSFPNSVWGNGSSTAPAISADGSVVAFQTLADNLQLAGTDTNAVSDVYVRVDGSLSPVRVSVSSSGVQANAACTKPRISADGRFVAFETAASNLVVLAIDSNGLPDVYRHDRSTATTFLVSARNGSDFAGNGASSEADLSADGQIVVFRSAATDLVAGDTNSLDDVFVRDVAGRATTRASLNSSGGQATGSLGTLGSYAPRCSSDGRHVAFVSDAGNLGGAGRSAYVRDRTTARTWQVNLGAPLPPAFEVALSANGDHVAWVTGGFYPLECSVYLRDWKTPATVGTFGSPCRGTGSGHVVLPSLLQARFGGSYNTNVPLTSGPARYQQLLLGGELPDALDITGIGLRQSSQHAGDAGGAIDIEIKVGYTTFGLANLSPTFAANFNVGAPVTVLPRTVVTLPNMPGSLPTDPTAMLAEIPFATPFAWQPLGLNLLIEIVTRTPAAFPYRIDAGNTIATTTLIGASDTATTGTLYPRSGPAIGLRTTNDAPPILIATGKPVLGGSGFMLHIRQGKPASAGVFFLGFSNTLWNGVALPLPLGLIGAGHCTLWISLDLNVTRPTDAAGAATFAIPIPFQPGTLGLPFHAQAAVYDPGANPLGLSFSQGLTATRGNY